MRITFVVSDKEREYRLAAAFKAGAEAFGDRVDIVQTGWGLGDVPIVAMVGVKSRALFRQARTERRGVVYFDKGYVRPGRNAGPARHFWRVAINDHQPVRHLMSVDRPHDRLQRLGLPFRRRTRSPTKTDVVLFAGGSQKNADWYDLGDATAFAAGVVRQLLEAGAAPVHYRPKPSWRYAVPVDGASFSPPEEPFAALLERTAVLVTHNSNASFEAAVAGVPVIALGPAIAAPISATSIAPGLRGLLPPVEAERRQWAANVAYWQWTEAEIGRGDMWPHIRPFLCE